MKKKNNECGFSFSRISFIMIPKGEIIVSHNWYHNGIRAIPIIYFHSGHVYVAKDIFYYDV